MRYLYEISFLAPLIATLVAIVNFLLVYRNFLSKPWNFKYWLILSMFFWIPWAGFTILLRLAENEEIALFYLRLSYISSYVTFYALFRFHNLLTIKRETKFLTFFMAVFMGINVALGMNPNFLDVTRTSDNLYYTDIFASTLLLLHVGFTLILGILVFRALRDINAISFFFGSDSKGYQVIVSFVLIILDIGLVVFYLATSDSQDATGFIILSILITSFLGFTYGVKPVSAVLSPQRLWTFFIIANNGLPVYEYHFSETDRIGELALISGAINASNITLMSYLGSKEPIQEVQLDDRVIIIENYQKTLFCLVADQNSPQMQIVHNEVVKQIINDSTFSIDESGTAVIKDVNVIQNYVNNAFSATLEEGY